MGDPGPGDVSVAVAEIAGVLSLATDVAMGHSFEHGLRSAVLAVRLGEVIGADEATRTEAYFVSLLKYVGCTAESTVFAGFFGDELVARAAAAPVVWGTPSQMRRAFLSRLGSSSSGLARAVAAARAMPIMKGQLEQLGAGHCEVAQMLSARVGLPGDYSAALDAIYERWDGKGVADFADFKAPCFLGRSRAVSALAAAAGRAYGLGGDELALLSGAALVQDVGRVAVPVGVWERVEPLRRDDWERIRLHPYHTERVVTSSPSLAASIPPLASRGRTGPPTRVRRRRSCSRSRPRRAHSIAMPSARYWPPGEPSARPGERQGGPAG